MARKADHTPLLLIGNDATGKWTQESGLARPGVIADVFREAAELAPH